MEAVVPQFGTKNKPYLEASWVPKEENRMVSILWVSQEYNQRGLYCGAR